MSTRSGLMIVGVWVAVACSADTRDSVPLRCPCASGWVCVPPGRCVSSFVGDGGRLSGEVDAALTRADAGVPRSDARVDDAGFVADGGRSDGAPDGGDLSPTACAGELQSTLRCESFETSLSSWFSYGSDSATIERVDPIYRGAGSLKSETSGMGGSAYVEAELFDHLRLGTIYARGYFWIPSDVSIRQFTLFGLQENESPWEGVKLTVQADGLVLETPDDAEFSSVVLPRDRWFCIQLETSLSDDDGYARVRVDGVVAVEHSDVSTVPNHGLSSFNVGITHSVGEQTPMRVFVDEIAVDFDPIPCD